MAQPARMPGAAAKGRKFFARWRQRLAAMFTPPVRVATPADWRPVGAKGTGVPGAGANGLEYLIGRRRSLAMTIITPADWRPVVTQPAGRVQIG